MSEIEGLRDYTPEKVKDGREPIKGVFKDCIFNYIRVEDYSGEIEELKGSKVLRYEIEIKDEGEFEGRRFWKTYNLNSEIGSGKKNKTPVQKLRDSLFTLGYDFKSIEELEAVCEELVRQKVAVSAYHFKGTEGNDVQMHSLRSIAKESDTKDSVPF